MLNGYALILYFERYGRKFQLKLAEMREIQWFSIYEIEKHQNEKLRELIKYAYENVPYYNRLMRDLKLHPSDFKTKSDLIKLPVLDKENIRRHFHDLITRDRKFRWFRYGHTSGTTGSPLEIIWDIRTCVVHHAAYWRQKEWAGIKYGDKIAFIQGQPVVPLSQTKPPFWRLDRIHNHLYLSSFHLKLENLPYYFRELEKFKPKVIEGYPSTVYILARYLIENGLLFPLKAVFTSSEPLLPIQRETIEKAFCCKVFDFYGMAERVVFATECEHHNGLHLNLDYSIVEITDEDGYPVPSGRTGRIVATSLHNYAMPLIRYKTSDITSARKEGCPCGRGFPLIDSVTTKDEDIIVTPDGRFISPSILTHPFKPIHNILESQIIQEDMKTIVVKIVKRPHYTEKDTQRLISGLKERLGAEVEVNIEFVDQIPRTSSGKFRWVVSKVPLKL